MTPSEFRRNSRCVADVHNFYNLSVFQDSVIDQYRAMQELPYILSFHRSCAHPGESAQQLDMIKKRLTEVKCSFCIVLSNAINDLSEIV